MSWKFAVTVMAGPKRYIVEAENYEEAFAKARNRLPDEWKRLDDDMTSTWKRVGPRKLTLSMENIRRKNSHACVYQLVDKG